MKWFGNAEGSLRQVKVGVPHSRRRLCVELVQVAQEVPARLHGERTKFEGGMR